MLQSLTSLSYDFLFPKLHGRWAAFLKDEELTGIIRSGGMEALQRSLAARNIDLANREEVQRQLVAHLIAEIWGIRRFVDARTAAYYDAFIERYFYENLKTVFHAHFFPERGARLASLLIESPALPPMDPEGIVAAQNVNQLYRQLPEHPCKEDLLPILVELEDTRDIQAAECRLAQMYYGAFLRATRRLPLGVRKCGSHLVQREIDFTNLIMVLRNAQLYHLPTDDLLALCIPEGELLDSPSLRALAESPHDSLLQKLPGEYRRLAMPLSEMPLYMLENALCDTVFGQAFTYFSDYNRPGLSIIAFPILKQFEVQNIIRLFEGLHFRLDSADIETMMVGRRHV